MKTIICRKQKSLQIKRLSLLTLLILFVSFQFQSFAQSSRVCGIVTDELSQPIVGTSVIIKDSSRGCVTDFSGYYAIDVQPSDKSLQFSFIGYETVVVPINGRDTIDVQLVPSKAALEECVVVGYSVQKKAMLTGSCSSTAPISRSKRKGAVAMSYDMEAEEQFNTENYSTIHENGFKSVDSDPLSTFSVDVDRASYTNIRRFINMGQLPPMDAVRIEEMINYFSYKYEQPKGTDPFAVNTQLATCPWNSENLIMKIGLKGREMDKSQLPASNIVFLIDVSGSMEAENKLPLLKSSLRLLVNEMRPKDKIAIVVYAGAAGLVLPSTAGNEKSTIINALDRLSAGGSTAGGEGLKLAYEVARDNFIKDGNNRIVLATDGDFNIGPSSNAEMERLVEKEREGGTAITVLGFGMGNYKDDRMEIIANKGNGNYSYIDNLQEAEKTLVKEFGGTLFTIAKDVKLQLEFNPAKVAAYRLIGYENRLLNKEDFNDDKKDAGEIGAGHTVTALYEIVPIDAPSAKKYKNKTDALKYQAKESPSVSNSDEWLTVKLRYKQPESNNSILMEHTVNQKPTSFDNADTDLRFAAGVAEFGMMLRNSEFKGSTNWTTTIDMIQNAKGDDEDGYRSELVRLVKMAEKLQKGVADNK